MRLLEPAPIAAEGTGRRLGSGFLSIPRHLAQRTLIAIAVLLSVTAACAQVDDRATGGGTPTTMGSSTTLEAPGAGADHDSSAFCSAVEVLDEHDGTTPETEAVAALEQVRRTAPESLQGDVAVILDTMIINNYPSSATSSMEKASFEEMDTSRVRLQSYVEEHCDPASTTPAVGS